MWRSISSKYHMLIVFLSLKRKGCESRNYILLFICHYRWSYWTVVQDTQSQDLIKLRTQPSPHHWQSVWKGLGTTCSCIGWLIVLAMKVKVVGMISWKVQIFTRLANQTAVKVDSTAKVLANCLWWIVKRVSLAKTSTIQVFELFI